MSENGDVPKMTCFCGICVHSGTRWMAWIVVIVQALFCLARQNLLEIPFVVLQLVVCALMFYGVQARRPNFYLPYLILTILFTVFNSCFIPFNTWAIVKKGHYYPHEISVFVSFMLIIVLVASPVYYLYIVVPYRSYKLTKYEKKLKNAENIAHMYPTSIYIPTTKVSDI